MTLKPQVCQFLSNCFGQNLPPRLGVAVSGGGDSVALLHVLADVLADMLAGREIEHACTLHAVSIDHGLRPEAAGEIDQVARLCERRAIAHSRYQWCWNQTGNLMAAAREGRRRAIVAWARQHDIAHVALGHTAEDQAETLVMHLARGSGIDGLAGMAPITCQQGVVWLRPLWGIRRAPLRTYLHAHGVRWAEDPSNQDPRFDRIKARRMIRALEPMGLSLDRLLRSAEHMARAQSALRWATWHLACQAARQQGGDVCIDAQELEQAPTELATRLLAAALCWVSGRCYRPRYQALRRLLRLTARCKGRATLHGCLLSLHRGELRITREWAAVAGHSAAVSCLWDGRWQAVGKAPAVPELKITALGPRGLRLCPHWRSMGMPRDSLLAVPALWRQDRLLAAPHAGLAGPITFKLHRERADFLQSLRKNANVALNPRD